MTLKPDWAFILKGAWSAWALWLAIALTGMEVFLQFFPWFDFMNEMQFAVVMLVISISALTARILVQASFIKRGSDVQT